MEKVNSFTLHIEGEGGQRLDVFLAGRVPDISRSYAQKLIEEGHVRVDGQHAKSKMKTTRGMVITVDIPEPEPLRAIPQNLPLDVVYEDRDMIIINKPKNLVVHPAPGNRENTLVNALLHYCGDSLSDINGVIRPGIVHRIDKDTSGLLAVAKNNTAHRELSKQLKEHSMERIYEAIVEGVIQEDGGVVDAPIGRHPVNRKKMAVTPGKGKKAITHFKVLSRMNKATHVQCRLETGRTHQIRVHMAFIRHPVYGDPVYGRSTHEIESNGQMLHAGLLLLTHPVTGERMQFEAPLPEEFVHLLQKLRGG